MGERSLAVNPLQTEVRERQRGKGRTGGQWVNSRAEIVEKAGQGEGQGASCAAGFGFGLEDLDRQPCLGQHNGCREAVGAGTDHIGALHVRGFLRVSRVAVRRAIRHCPLCRPRSA